MTNLRTTVAVSARPENRPFGGVRLSWESSAELQKWVVVVVVESRADSLGEEGSVLVLSPEIDNSPEREMLLFQPVPLSLLVSHSKCSFNILFLASDLFLTSLRSTPLISRLFDLGCLQ